MQVSKFNEVYFRIDGEYEELIQFRRFTSFFAPNFQYHPKFKAHMWDGKISYFDARNRLFPIGLYYMIEEFCKNYERPLELAGELFDKRVSVSKEQVNEFAKKLDLPFELRDYQAEEVAAAMTNARGVIVSATGSGKSLVIYTAIRMILEETDGKVLLVVPKVALVEQMYSDFASYNWKDEEQFVEKLYAEQKPTFKKRVLITTYQSIMRKSKEFFEPYVAIINDEAHSVKSTELQKIAQNCVNAKFRLGFTGTMPKVVCDNLNICGMLGQPIYELKSKELIDEGVLSKVTVVNLFLKYPEEIAKLGKNRSYPEEVELIEKSSCRMQAFDYILKNIPFGQNTLILVNHLEHLDKLKEHLEAEFGDKMRIHDICGRTNPLEREELRKEMDEKRNVIIVATYGTMSTGVNIRKIHNVIFGSSSKSEIRVLQSIGRGLRTHKSKEQLILWDLVDDFSYETKNGKRKYNYMVRHWEERYNFYGEQEFPCVKRTLTLI